MKRGVKTITGNNKVKAGVWETYTVTEWHPDTPLEDRNEEAVKWMAFNVTTGKAIKILEKEIGHFRFSEKAIGQKYLLVAYIYKPELNDTSAIEIKVVPAQEAKILSVAVSDVNDKPFTTAVAYGQIVNIHVSTVGMVGHHLEISLWEDDAKGAGHSKENQKNFIEKKTAVVGSKGIAHCQFVMKANFALIANAHLAKGDKNEGSTHEYYVTVYALGMLTIASYQNILLTNPDYKPKTDQERKTETEDHLKGKTKPKEILPPVKIKVPIQEPKVNPTPPVTAPKAAPTLPAHQPPAQQKGITHVYIRDPQGKPITGVYTGKELRVYIVSNGIKDKTIKVTLYEEDLTTNDFIAQSDPFTITGDLCYVPIALSHIPRDLGGYYFEGGSQELFVNVEFVETHTKIASAVVKVDTKVFKVDTPTSVAKIFIDIPDEVKKGTGVCVCKDYDLIWGNKVSCDFRKKVVEICKDLWGESRKMEMANNLMAVFQWETGGTFKTDVPNQAGSGATGLIQFMPDKATEYFGKCTMETVPNYFKSTNVKLHNLPRVKEFAEMTAIKQLDYVKKYFEPLRDIKLDFIDFYLQVLFPISSGKPEHVVFADSISKLDLINESDKLKSLRVEKYARNSGMDSDKDGKVMKSEIAKSVVKYKTEGLAYKSIDKCDNIKEVPTSTECGKDCICTINPIVDSEGFVSNKRIDIEHITFIEHGEIDAKVKGIVLHRTENYTTKQTINAFKNKRDGVYYGTHFIVGKDGDITQTASFNQFTYHAKVTKSPAQGVIHNSNSIGIEVVGKFETNNVEKGKWEDVSEIQAKAVVCLVKMLLKKYTLTFKDNIYCHDQISSKTDGEGTVVYNAIKKYF
jgi:hypothetical protein